MDWLINRLNSRFCAKKLTVSRIHWIYREKINKTRVHFKWKFMVEMFKVHIALQMGNGHVTFRFTFVKVKYTQTMYAPKASNGNHIRISRINLINQPKLNNEDEKNNYLFRFTNVLWIEATLRNTQFEFLNPFVNYIVCPTMATLNTPCWMACGAAYHCEQRYIFTLFMLTVHFCFSLFVAALSCSKHVETRSIQTKPATLERITM